jgi:Cys-tRNA(Pro)/Cys-tRNA(Cys) deacylase
METRATQELDEKGIPYRLFQHSGPLESLEQAAAERGQQPGQVVRSILFRLGGAECPPNPCFVMALVAGPRQISWPALRRQLNTNRVTMATPQEVLAVTGCVIGTVSPLGLPPGALARPVLVDQSVLLAGETGPQAELSLGSGQRGLAILLQPAHLLQALPGAELVDLL